jgi:uncharacterized protein YecE (DUF72 family)
VCCRGTAPTREPSVRKPIVRVGTAGWTIPLRYQSLLAGDGSHLERYAHRLNAVEINSSFHRHHRVQTYVRWARCVPAHFRFAVKVPRTLTHDGKLAPLPEVLDQFAAEVYGLGRKLGVLLVQLPPKLAFEAPVARRFFSELRKRIDVPIACEPRHPSWGSQRAASVLTECAVARVAADPSPLPGADEPGGSEQLAYFRWHGQPRKYYSDYDREQLEALWRQLAVASKTAGQVWIIFDNTVLGYAFENAMATTAAGESTGKFNVGTAEGISACERDCFRP